MQVYESEKKDCAWWNVLCWESDCVATAKTIEIVMSALYTGGCQDGMPSN